MRPDTDSRTAELFEAVLDLEPSDRAAYLERACAGDAALRAKVESLLAMDAQAGEFLVPPDRDADLPGPSVQSLDPVVGTRIGRYRVVDVIASGGMGTVYEALQEEPRRRVALKVIRAGLASGRALSRFLHEAEILARLRHPGIAQVFEADAHGGGGGMPYFAMEYVPGAKAITRYAEDKQLSTRQRMELFATVCDAVHHGHQRGIIHRDLKPGNILVDDSGQPKVIDFGVARATDADMTIATMQTNAGEMVGTLRYMSPEQCEGDSSELDTRCDVYSLGVVLYELLSGQFPYDLSTSSPFDVPRVIREGRPRRLSSICRTLRGDVETIVLKALEKGREQRYQSAAELAADIRHFLRHEPIEAKRDSAWYTFRKTLVRYRRFVAAATLVVVLLAVFGIASFIQAEHNRRLASDLQRQLTVSNIERGRAFARAGNLWDAEDLIWREHLRSPGSRHSYWALWELYSHNRSLARLVGHDGKVRAGAFASDGRSFVTGGDDNLVKIWDTATFRIRCVLEGHDDEVWSVACSPDGRGIASGSLDGTVMVWDATTGARLHTLSGHTEGAYAVAFAPDGRHLVSGDGGGSVRVWDVGSGRCATVLGEHTARVARLQFSPDGTILASGSDDHTVRLWRGLRGPSIATLSEHQGWVYGLAFSPDGRALASGGTDKVVKLWDLTTQQCTATIDAVNGTVRFLRFRSDGETLICGGWGRFDEWNVVTHERRPLIEHGAAVGGSDLSPDGRLIVTGFGGVRVTDVSAGAGEIRLGGKSNRGGASISPDGRVIACGSAARGGRLWETQTGQLLATLGGQGPRWSSSHFHPSGALLATCHSGGLVKLWDLVTGEQIDSFDGNHTATCDSLSFSPDGRTMALTRQDGAIQMREVPTCRVLGAVPPAESELLSVCFSPDGRSIAAAYRGGAVRLFSAHGEPLAELETTVAPWTVAFSADGKELAIGCWGMGEIQVWDLATNTVLLRLEEPRAVVWDVAYQPGHPDILASCSDDGTVNLWELRGPRNLLRLEPFGGVGASAVSFTPDGKTLVATGGDGSLCVWDLEYFDRHMAGNLHYQMELLRPELGDTIQTDSLSAWADEVMHRAWPRIGPHAAARASQTTALTDPPRLTPEIIASWGRGAPSQSPP